MKWIDGRTPARVASVALLAWITGCGNFTAGGLTETRVRLSGDAPSATPALARLDPGTVAVTAPRSSDDDDQPEGEVEAEFGLYLVRDDGALVALTDEDVRVRVDLEGVEEPQVAAQLVEVAVYTGFRIVFTEIEAEVDAGLIINGEPVTGPIDVELEGPDLVVDRPIALDLDGEDVVEILVDLNAADWLQAVDPMTATVEAQAFAGFIEVTVR